MPLEEFLCWDQDPAWCRPGHTPQWCQTQISYWHLWRFCISGSGSPLNSGQVTWNASASLFSKCLQVTIFLSEKERQRKFPANACLQVHTVCPYAATSNKSLTLSVPSWLPWDQFCGASTSFYGLLQYGGQAGLAQQLFLDMASLQMFVKRSFKVQFSAATVVSKNKRDTGNQSLLSKNKARPELQAPPQSPLCCHEMSQRKGRDVLLFSASLKSISTGAVAQWRNYPRGFGLGGCSCSHKNFNHFCPPTWIKITGVLQWVMLWSPSSGGEGHFSLLCFKGNSLPKANIRH